MNKEDPYRQKTDHTRKRINRPQAEEKASVTSLPPRSEIHQKRREKQKKKVSFPLIRVLVLFFILLPITVFAVYTYRDVIFPKQNKPVIAEKGGYETISIDNSEAKKGASNKESDDENKGILDKEQPNENSEEQKSNDASNSQSVTIPEAAAPDEGNTQPNPVAPPEQNSAVAGVSQTPVDNAAAGNVAANNVEIKEHTVKTGETLYRIAINYYGSKTGIDKIKKANNLRNNEIHVGQVLKIPIEN